MYSLPIAKNNHGAVLVEVKSNDGKKEAVGVVYPDPEAMRLEKTKNSLKHCRLRYQGSSKMGTV